MFLRSTSYSFHVTAYYEMVSISRGFMPIFDGAFNVPSAIFNVGAWTVSTWRHLGGFYSYHLRIYYAFLVSSLYPSPCAAIWRSCWHRPIFILHTTIFATYYISPSLSHLGYDSCLPYAFMANLIIPPRPYQPLLDKVLIMAAVHPSSQTTISCFSSSSYILDQQHPAMEPADKEHDNSIFGRRFGVPITDGSSISDKRLTNAELLHCYSIPLEILPKPTDSSPYTLFLDDNIQFFISFQLRAYVTNALLDHVGVTDNIAFSASEISDNLQCYNLTKPPTTVNWTAAYRQDSSTSVILNVFTNSSKLVWSNDFLDKADLECCSHSVVNWV